MSVDFVAWCRQNRQRCVLVELDYMFQVGTGDAAVPTKGTLHLSNLGYVDEAASPVQTYDEALLSVPTYERALDPATLRGAAQVTIGGALVINNADGRYDFLLTLPIDGSECRVYVGDPAWAQTDFVHLFTALQAKASVPTHQAQLEVALTDIGLLLNKSIGGTVVVGGTGPDAAKFRPLPFGYVHNMTPDLVDAATFTYAYADRATNASVPVVRANGVALTVTTDYVDSGGTFALVANPQGNEITCDVLLHSGVSTNYRVSDALTFFIGGEAGLTALGKFAGAHATYFDSGVSVKPLNDYHCGVVLNDKTNVIAPLLDDLMSTANGFWNQYRTGEFYYGRMRPEALSAIIGLSGGRLTVLAQIGIDDVMVGTIQLDHRLPTYASYQNVANVNQTQQTTFAGTLSSDQRVMLSRQGLTSPVYEGEEPTATAYLGASVPYKGGAPQLYDLSMSDSQLVPTLISGASDTDVPDVATGTSIPAMQSAFNALRRAQFLPWTEFVDFTTFLDFYALEIGDIVNLTYPRFDLDGGELHQVYRIALDAMKARIDLGVTRRRFSAVTGAVPPFDFLLMETGDLVLLESGDDIIISTSGGTSVFNLLLDGGGTLLQLNGSHLQIH